MPLGDTKANIVKAGRELGIFVKRRRVERLSLSSLRAETLHDLSRSASFLVRDDHIRKVLLAHIEAADTAPAKKYSSYPCVTPGGPQIRKVRVLQLHQRSLMVRVSTGFAYTANNHHLAIFRLPGGKVVFDPPVTLFEAARRLSMHVPIVKRTRDDGATFVMSLAAGDAVEFPNGGKEGIWIVRGVCANGQIILERATDATGSTRSAPSPGAFLKGGARKVSVDPIGRIRPAND
jgi:CRISPR-associated endonuclease Csn1